MRTVFIVLRDCDAKHHALCVSYAAKLTHGQVWRQRNRESGGHPSNDSTQIRSSSVIEKLRRRQFIYPIVSKQQQHLTQGQRKALNPNPNVYHFLPKPAREI